MAVKVQPTKKQTQFLPLILIVLTVVTLVLYAPVFRDDFVNYDDPDYVTENSHVQHGLNWADVKWAFTTGHASNWHPLTWLSHMVDYQLYGLKPAGHHATNLLFHTANVLLLFWVLWRLTGRMWPSAFVAALFAWHPLHVESIAWVSERKDVLSTFFWLLTMLAYSRYVRKPSAGIYLVMLFCFALGLLSKPMVITLPFVLLLLDYWPLGRIHLTEPGSWRKPALEKLPLILLMACSSVVTFLVQRHGGAVSTSLSIGQRISNAFVSYLRYTGKMFWPQDLSILYPHPGNWPALLVGTGVVFVLGVTLAAIFLIRRQPYLAVGWFWFLGTAIPVIGLVQVGVQAMADRYTYIPLIGLFIAITWGVVELLAGWKRHAWGMGMIGGATLAGCLVITFTQEQYWKSSEKLFRHAVNVTKDNYLAYNNLGYFLDHDGKRDEALENYEKSLKINPNYEDALNNMGYALAGKGRYDEAIPYYERALRINPKLVEAHNNLGNALSEQGKVDEAIKHYIIALNFNPDHADAHNNFGIALAMQGRFDEAVQHLAESVRLRPTYASAHSNLGNAYAVQHKLDEAIAQYELALQLKPDDAQAHNNLANVFSEQGRLDEAVEHYQAALRLKADNPEAHFNLGMVLHRKGKVEEAKSHFLEALRLKPSYADAQKQLDDLHHHKE